MEESAKETIIIVHGTWAAPTSGTTHWYEPSDGAAAGGGFVEKLDAALQVRASPARCWAHCTNRDQIFHWSGKNSWIARAQAAFKLGEYVSNLQNEGWRCHIIAHSHGGNVVVEALPKIAASIHFKDRPGTITALGTPFMDTKAPIFEQRKAAGSSHRVALFMAILLGLAALGFGIYSGFLWTQDLAGKALFCFTFFYAVLFIYSRRVQSLRTSVDDVLQWLNPWRLFNRVVHPNTKSSWPQVPFLTIGSRMD